MTNGQMGAIEISSWSNVLPAKTHIESPDYSSINDLVTANKLTISRGAGKSFGDASYITNGLTISSRKLNRILDFDQQLGTITCESGVRMIDLHLHLKQSEWSFPIYGGSRWVTIGGATASDIHGKNVETFGSFGHHVLSITLLIANGQEIECSRDQQSDLFAATIGGMGLTGIIKKVALKLQKGLRKTVRIRVNSYSQSKELIAHLTNSHNDFQFCDWIECTNNSFKGLYWVASYSDGISDTPRSPLTIWHPTVKIFNKFTMPLIYLTNYLINNNLDKETNILNYNYLGPSERFKSWNKLFGANGFIEYHFLVPTEHFQSIFTRLVTASKKHGLSVYFAVLKKFKIERAEGLLSFPKTGLGFNFQMYNSAKSRDFLVYFTDILLEYGGHVYLAKDSCILPRQFEKMYVQIDRWRDIVYKFDRGNKFQSNLSRRLNLKPW